MKKIKRYIIFPIALLSFSTFPSLSMALAATSTPSLSDETGCAIDLKDSVLNIECLLDSEQISALSGNTNTSTSNDSPDNDIPNTGNASTSTTPSLTVTNNLEDSENNSLGIDDEEASTGTTTRTEDISQSSAIATATTTTVSNLSVTSTSTSANDSSLVPKGDDSSTTTMATSSAAVATSTSTSSPSTSTTTEVLNDNNNATSTNATSTDNNSNNNDDDNDNDENRDSENDNDELDDNNDEDEAEGHNQVTVTPIPLIELSWLTDLPSNSIAFYATSSGVFARDNIATTSLLDKILRDNNSTTTEADIESDEESGIHMVKSDQITTDHSLFLKNLSPDEEYDIFILSISSSQEIVRSDEFKLRISAKSSTTPISSSTSTPREIISTSTATNLVGETNSGEWTRNDESSSNNRIQQAINQGTYYRSGTGAGSGSNGTGARINPENIATSSQNQQ